MAKEICISSTPHETRLAILEDDQLSEIYYERENEYTLAGSIYNGRVTRVLPGMQSAFVDIGLERDAFLYVTDFLELEDQEDSDEIEKVAVSSSAQPPREIQHAAPAASPERRPRREPQPTAAPEAEEAVAEQPALSAGDAQTEPQDEFATPKRWRGRRRRRGSRSAAQGAQEQPQLQPAAVTEAADAEEFVETVEESVGFDPVLQSQPAEPERKQAQPAAPPAARPEPAAFVLPGESLSKYGGVPVETEKTEPAKPAAPAKPLTQFKPANLIESPLEWDGSGLLPGESLARHRSAAPEASAPDAVEEEQVQEQTLVEDAAPAAEPESGLDLAADQLQVEEELMEEEELAPPAQAAAADTDEPEANASASHNIDPAAPSGFRLFGFGKKKDEESATSAEKPVSSYAPGQGHLEEELIEEEQLAAPRRNRRPAVKEQQDLDDLEEETLGRAGQEEASAQPAQEGGQRRERSGRNRRSRTGSGSSSQGRGGRAPSRRSMQTTELPAITDLLKPGQEILVQIAKEPIAKKGARITSHIALPGRFLVFMPTVSHVGVSRKIASDEERQRLKRILIHERGEATGGFIVRTAAEGASEEELRADLRFLLNLWQEINTRSQNSKSPALIYHDLSLIERILRDQVSSDFANIWVDSEADYERIVRFLNHFSPTLVRRVKLYTKEVPLFEHFGVQDEISKALRSKVWLKSGGSIVINQTEALVAIDINTGKYVGKSARLEDTIVKTNLDAVPEIVRQIRLRDLGGIIVIDFIDMDERKNRFKVLAALEEALKSDRAPTKVLQFNDFGLVAITRKRVKQSLERTLSVPCPVCQATGMVKSPTTVCNEIWTEMKKMRKHFDAADVTLRIHPETLKVLKLGNGRWLAELEDMVGKNILPKADPSLHPEQFDIQG